MKISFRILLINFTVVVIILVSATAVFYSLIYNTLNSQQTRNLTNSSNSFIYSFQKLISDLDDELLFFYENRTKNKTNLLNSRTLDFIISVQDDGERIKEIF